MNNIKPMPVDPKVQWANDKCDKYDYLISVFCGAAAGAIDVFFVGIPGASKAGKISDATADEMVKGFARMMGWKAGVGGASNPASAIGFLERRFPVNYDHTSTKAVGGQFRMSTKNHHIKSLAHCPDIIGLFFSILDQFTNTATFLNGRGGIVQIDTSDSGFELRGSTFPEKLFCGFCNWLGHLMSDLAGSSGSRGKGLEGRGTGIPIPFAELFLMCNFGRFQVGKDRQTLADIMTRAFQEGYDARHGGAMAIPVLLEECMIRVLWSVKRHFYAHKDWSECIPTNAHADLRIMLIVGNATLCLIDGADAVIRSGGNALAFVLHMNLIAWARLVLLVLRELRIRYGSSVDAAAMKFLSQTGFADKYALRQYYERMGTYRKNLDEQLRQFTVQVEKEYKEFEASVDYILNGSGQNSMERMRASAMFAAKYGVPQNRIMHSTRELDAWIMGKVR